MPENCETWCKDHKWKEEKWRYFWWKTGSCVRSRQRETQMIMADRCKPHERRQAQAGGKMMPGKWKQGKKPDKKRVKRSGVTVKDESRSRQHAWSAGVTSAPGLLLVSASILPLSILSPSLCLFYLPHIKMHHGTSQGQTRTPVKAQENDQQHEHSLSITSERLISRWLYCFGINIFKMPASSCQNGGFMLTTAWLI